MAGPDNAAIGPLRAVVGKAPPQLPEAAVFPPGGWLEVAARGAGEESAQLRESRGARIVLSCRNSSGSRAIPP